MPRWALWLIVLGLILLVYADPGGMATVIGRFLNAVFVFISSLAGNVR